MSGATKGADVDAHVEDREAGVAPHIGRIDSEPTIVLMFGFSRPVPITISVRPR